MRSYVNLIILFLLAAFVVYTFFLPRQAITPDTDSADGSYKEAPGTAIKIQGITLINIPGGTFQMGSKSDSSDGHQVHSITLSAFEMSIKEITNAQYVEYLNTALVEGEITASSSSVTGARGDFSGKEYINLSGSYDANNKCWITYGNDVFTVAPGKENWPVVYVSWYGAKAFALKNGMDLPTEAQWEYAACGGKQYEYGTDDGTISSDKANYMTYVGYLTDVGSYPANPFGLYDMAGNVWEWCNDWYDSSYYSQSGKETDPLGPHTGSSRVVRGGGWYSLAAFCRSSERAGAEPYGCLDRFGFRVVRGNKSADIN